MFDTRGEVWKSFIVMSPTLGAALIAISRIMDARHHPFDVISGSILGMTMAYISYRQYFPPLSESWRKGRAYPIRSWASGPRRPRFDERQVSRDESVEPLRSAMIRTDEEQPKDTFKSPRGTPTRAAAHAELEENVFRQQISKSQRIRQADIQNRSGRSSSLAESEPRADVSQFANLSNLRGRQGQGSQTLSPSSSDHGLGEDGFEMERNPRISSSEPQERETHPAYRLTTKDFEQDTRYHSPARSPKSSDFATFQSLRRVGSLSSIRSVADHARTQSK